jgi:hypothetical protein
MDLGLKEEEEGEEENKGHVCLGSYKRECKLK